MNKKNLLKKILVVGIIVLFIGTGAANGINGKINRNDIDEKTLNILSNQNVCSLNLHIFDKTKEKQNNINIPIDAAKNIYNKLEDLKYMIVYKPRSDETKTLKIEFVDLLDNYGLIPAGLTKDYVLSLLNPPWFKNKQKTSKERTTLSKNLLSYKTEKIIYLQQVFKNCFGKTILKNILTPYPSAAAVAWFCSIGSGGSGGTFPLFLLPRPRGIAIWAADFAETAVGEFFLPLGFMAEGAQLGTMFGFIGIGLTYAFPEGSVYGFVGYAISVRVIADSIYFP